MSQKMENNNETKDKVNYQLMSVQILPIMQVERLFCLLSSSILQVQPFWCFLVLHKPSLVHFCFETWVLLTGFVPFFEQKIQGLLRTHFPFFKDSIQLCKKESWVYGFFQFFHNMSNFILKVFLCLLLSGTWEFRSDKVSTKIQGLSRPSFF